MEGTKNQKNINDTIASNLKILLPKLKAHPFPIMTIKEIDDFIIGSVHITPEVNIYNFTKHHPVRYPDLSYYKKFPIFMNRQQINYIKERFKNNSINDDIDINDAKYSSYISFFD